jgi:predicted nucleic acid-binding protein
MEQKYLIDTNVLIDIQRNRFNKNSLTKISDIIDNDFSISFITYIEYLGYKDISEASKEFISLSNMLEIDSSIIEICIKLRRTYKIKLPDAIIAATAISENRMLITNNEKDFVEINNLKIQNPYNI